MNKKPDKCKQQNLLKQVLEDEQQLILSEAVVLFIGENLQCLPKNYTKKIFLDCKVLPFVLYNQFIKMQSAFIFRLLLLAGFSKKITAIL